MLPSSDLYGAALPYPHRRAVKVTVRTPDGTLLAEDLPILGGSVSAQLTSRVTRSASFSMSREWLPATADDVMSPSHAIVQIEAGIRYPDGTPEMFPVFTGRVYSARLGSDGSVTFRADDLAADVVVADFEQPFASQQGASTVAEVRRIISLAYPYAVFGPDDVDDAPVPRLVWDDDRGRALDDLAAVAEARWFTLGNGNFVVRRLDYEALNVVSDLRDGPGGTLLGADVEITADGVYNSVVVLGDRLDGDSPIRAVERLDNAVSAYRFAGPFGQRVRKIRLQTATTPFEAQRAARSRLAADSALVRQWSMQCVPDHRLEPGDVVTTTSRGLRDTQVIDSITYPLFPDEDMTLSGRSRIDGDLG